MKDSDRLNQKR
uniref:Uncharacterized protein n=1 Tax=Anguilla anguilla TaxID=7936 RepID=A0A0E9R287_ANGAN